MLPSELTAEQAMAELQILIDAEPFNTGWAEVDDDYKDAGCVYFLNEDDIPVSPGSNGRYGYADDVRLVTPVCIIGRWVQDFHPEWKNIPELDSIFRDNRSLGSCDNEDVELPWRDDVVHILKNAQAIQDRDESTWGDIDFSSEYFPL